MTVLLLAGVGCTADIELGFESNAGVEGQDESGTDGNEGGDSGQADERGGDNDGDAGGDSGDEGGDGGGGGEAGSSDDGGDDGAETAQREVDILFVIDNSSSMAVEQEQLQVAVTSFIEDTFDMLSDASVHLGVITTDSPMLGERTCVYGANLDQDYLEVSGQSDLQLQAWIHCALAVGIVGDVQERPVDSLLEALDADGPDANIGFSRPDATLVVVLVSDEDDLGSQGEPSGWASDLIALRGDAQQVVMLSLIGNESSACAIELSLPLLDTETDLGTTKAVPGVRLREMTQAVPHHVVGDICQLDYAEFFEMGVWTMEEVTTD